MTERVWGILVSSFVKILIPGIKVTIPLTITSFALSMVLGVLLAVAQNSNIKLLDRIAQLYIWIFRGTPLIVQLFIIFFGLGSMGIIIPAFWAATLAFGLNLAAYNAETIRAAIEAIPKDQYEAASVSGMNYNQTMRHIVLPQASRIAFPSLFNNLISLLKDTSLAASITVVDLFTTAQQIAARTYEPFALYCEAAVIYLIFCTFLTWVQKKIEARLDLMDK